MIAKILHFIGIIVITALIVIIAGSLGGCAVKPPNFPLCVEMSMTRGECIKVVSGEKLTVDETHKLNDKTWWESRPTNLILPLESWLDIKKFIIKLCKKNDGMCEAQISTWERSLDVIDSTVKEKAPLSQGSQP